MIFIGVSHVNDVCAKPKRKFVLNYVVSNAYQRSDLLEKRRVLIQEWADVILPRD